MMYNSVLFLLLCTFWLTQTTAEEELTCLPPPTLERATLQEKPATERYSIGDVIKYVCNPGYLSDGEEISSRCYQKSDSRTTAWSEPKECRPRSCGDPGYVENAHIEGSLFTFPNKVTFICDEGYKPIGTMIRFCQPGGTWSGRLPKCRPVLCERPDDIQNGKVSFTSLHFGAKLEYQCDKGFFLTNHQERECLNSGQWSGQTPECTEIRCKTIDPPDHGIVTLMGEQERVGSIALFACDEGRLLHGSERSTCLDTGEWTFPTPECLDPCTVPEIPNGRLGIWVPTNRRNNYAYKELPPGTKVEDNHKLFVHCNPRYEPLGRADWQAKVTCKNGRWSNKPVCLPAACRSKPPTVDHAQPSHVNQKHGEPIWYECDQGLIKSKTGNVTCVYGYWKGVKPECTDVRCHVTDLGFAGLIQAKMKYFMPGETLNPLCSEGYRLSKPNQAELKCQNGRWIGHLPPCIPKECSGPPPIPIHGSVKSYSSVHSSAVNYECHRYYYEKEKSTVQCLFGKWEGQPPVCADSRCYLADLKKNYAVALTSANVTMSGEYLKVQCIEGYSVEKTGPQCVDGKWIEENKSPCEESFCVVDKIPNGDITEMKLVDNGFNFRKFRWEKKSVFETVRFGVLKLPHSELYASCYRGFYFHGIRNLERERIVCKKGKWRPEPVCLPPGTHYEENKFTEAPTETTLDVTNRPRFSSGVSQTSAESTNRQTVDSAQEVALRKLYVTALEDNQNESDCSCEITVQDDELLAYVNGEKVGYKTRVRNGSSVLFQCRNFGVFRLQGPRRLTCKECRSWHSTEFPTCSYPQTGDVAVFFNNSVKVSPEGVIEIQRGGTVAFTCISINVNQYPIWKYPNTRGIQVKRTSDMNGLAVFANVLNIRNADSMNSGNYTCSLINRRQNVLTIYVVDPLLNCPVFETADGLAVQYEYEMDRISKAKFSCNSGHELKGENVVNCLSNGTWSSDMPQCIDVTCPKLTETEHLRIYYTDGQRFNSTATFHCFSPAIRSGAAHARCLLDGTWSHPIPFCDAPHCDLGTLYDVVPEGVIPVMEGIVNHTVSFKTTVHITCENEDFVLLGSDTAECGENGVWKVDKVHCVAGCGPVQKPAKSVLIVEPDQPQYRFGDFIFLSCPPGFNLTSEVQVMMCIPRGWSDEEVPDCESTEVDE